MRTSRTSGGESVSRISITDSHVSTCFETHRRKFAFSRSNLYLRIWAPSICAVYIGPSWVGKAGPALAQSKQTGLFRFRSNARKQGYHSSLSNGVVSARSKPAGCWQVAPGTNCRIRTPVPELFLHK